MRCSRAWLQVHYQVLDCKWFILLFFSKKKKKAEWKPIKKSDSYFAAHEWSRRILWLCPINREYLSQAIEFSRRISYRIINSISHLFEIFVMSAGLYATFDMSDHNFVSVLNTQMHYWQCKSSRKFPQSWNDLDLCKHKWSGKIYIYRVKALWW